MSLRSESGTVTAELAISLPAVLLVLVLSIGLLGVQFERIKLAYSVGQQARALARGESVAGQTSVEGNLVCVAVDKPTLIPISEKQCARRLGL